MQGTFFTGQCLCGTVRYFVEGDAPTAFFLCHCSRCRTGTGTMHAANVFFANATVVWQQGANNRTAYTVADSRHSRSFCKTCGSPLPRQEGSRGVVAPAGALEPSAQLQPTAHIFTGDSAAWENGVADLPTFVELPDVT